MPTIANERGSGDNRHSLPREASRASTRGADFSPEITEVISSVLLRSRSRVMTVVREPRDAKIAIPHLIYNCSERPTVLETPGNGLGYRSERASNRWSDALHR